MARERLSRQRVVEAAVALADTDGVEAVSMRRLAADLDVVPMALYKHVQDKAALLDAMMDEVISQIAPPDESLPWKQAIRTRILDARRVLLLHPWVRPVMEAKSSPTPTVLGYMDSTIAVFLAGGLSLDLTHHVMHALGSRIFGFSQELFTGGVEVDPAAAAQLAEWFPNVLAVAVGADHDPDSTLGPGCDDQFEFEFALDLQLDAVHRLHEQKWRSSEARGYGRTGRN